jgi:hypothetical protein
MAQSSLEGDASRSGRPTEACIRGRDGHQHLAFPAVRLLPQREKGLRSGSAQPWGEHHTACEYELRGDDPCLAVEGITTTTVFEAYVEEVLAPTLRRGQIVVVDKTSALIRVRGSGS